MQIDISGSTTILRLNVAYLAVDPTFPHHLNSFDNVPINYGQNLINITTKQNFTTYYSNIINYSVQAAGRQYNTFQDPLDSNKILLYITSINIMATGLTLVSTFPFNMRISYQIISSTTYNISVSISIQAMITKLQFSMIIFNQNDVENSKKYFIVY